MTPTGEGDDQPPFAFEPESYAGWFETELGSLVWQDEREALLSLIGPVAGRTVLDAGVGEARLALDLTRRGARVTGVDASPEMLRFAQRRSRLAGARLPLAAGRLETLPFRNSSFDLVVTITVLCFVPAPGGAVREMARVLRPGGRLVIAELGRWSLWAARRRVSGFLGNARWKQARFWSHADLGRLLRESGLRVKSRRSAVFYPPHPAAARLLRPLERALSRREAGLGAAFLAVAAEKSE